MQIVNCGVVERVKRNTVERMGSEEFVKKVSKSQLEGPNRRERPLERWKDRVEEYLGERGISGKGVLKEARREC